MFREGRATSFAQRSVRVHFARRLPRVITAIACADYKLHVLFDGVFFLLLVYHN
ncbi:hypothetical protein LINGRAHAP2_LOCUS11993 [Linum grandiflorum]